MDNVRRSIFIALMTIMVVLVVCLSANCGISKLTISGTITIDDNEMSQYENMTIDVQLRNALGDVIANGKVYGMDLPATYRIEAVEGISDEQEYIVCAMATDQYGYVQWAAFEHILKEHIQEYEVDLKLNGMQLIKEYIHGANLNELRFMRDVTVEKVDDSGIRSSFMLGWTQFFVTLETGESDKIYHFWVVKARLEEKCIYDIYYKVGELRSYLVGSELLPPQSTTGKILIGYVLKGCKNE